MSMIRAKVLSQVRGAGVNAPDGAARLETTFDTAEGVDLVNLGQFEV